MDLETSDDFENVSQQHARMRRVLTNGAFVNLMIEAIAKGKETARPGTFVDLTPPISAIRLRGTVPMSHCGSPAAMCVESGSDHGGAETLK